MHSRGHFQFSIFIYQWNIHMHTWKRPVSGWDWISHPEQIKYLIIFRNFLQSPLVTCTSLCGQGIPVRDTGDFLLCKKIGFQVIQIWQILNPGFILFNVTLITVWWISKALTDQRFLDVKYCPTSKPHNIFFSFFSNIYFIWEHRWRLYSSAFFAALGRVTGIL